MRLSRKDFSNVLMCVVELYLQVAALAASQVYTCTIGETAKLLWLRSGREHLKEFKQYRAWKNNVSFAIIDNGTQNASCLNDILKTFCLTKVHFQVWNETHLLLTINNTSFDDSGNYSVEHVFGGMEGNYKGTMPLKIQAGTTPTVLTLSNLTTTSYLGAGTTPTVLTLSNLTPTSYLSAGTTPTVITTPHVGDDKPAATAIIPIAVVIAAVLIAFLALVCYLYRKKTRTRNSVGSHEAVHAERELK